MVYFTLVRTGVIKIGVTTEQDLTTRIRQLSRRYGHEVQLLAFMEGDRRTERLMHEKFAEYRLGRPEHFRTAPELLGFIGQPFLEVSDKPVKPRWLDEFSQN